MARRARLMTGQEVTVDDAGAEALSRAPQFDGWVDGLDSPGQVGRVPIKQTNGGTVWAPPEFADVALRQPSSSGGEAMRALVDTFGGSRAKGEAASRADLPVATTGAWTPPEDWAQGGAKLRAIQASPRETALGRFSQPAVISAQPETGEWTQMENANADYISARDGQQRIRISPEELAATRATQDGLAADEEEADRKRQANLDLVNRTRVPTPAPRSVRPGVSGQQVGSGGSVRAPVDLAALAPAGSMERGLSNAGAPSALATGGNEATPASKTPLADQLARLQQQGVLSRLGTGISRAGARINEALTGAKADKGFFDGLDEESARSIQDFAQRNALAQQEGDRAKKMSEEAALKDKFSAESKRFQAALAKTLPGVYSPEELANMTAADAPMVTDFAKMKAALDARKPQADPNADLERKRLEAQIGLIDAQTQAASRKGRGGAPLRPGAVSPKEQQKIDAEQRKLAERNVGGFAFDPANPPTMDGAKKMAEAAKARDEILGSLNRLENLFKAHGTEAGGGAAQSEMESERTNILNRLRTLNEMGVPNGRDYEVLAQQIPELTGVGAMFTRNSTLEPKFNALRGQIARTLDATAKAYKFRPQSATPRVAAPTDSTGAMDLDTVTIIPPPAPDGTPRPSKQVPRSEVQRYLDAGASLANG